MGYNIDYSVNCKICSNSRENCTCHLYKPIEKFAWEDASEEEMKENSIEAYTKYAFKD